MTYDSINKENGESQPKEKGYVVTFTETQWSAFWDLLKKTGTLLDLFAYLDVNLMERTINDLKKCYEKVGDLRHLSDKWVGAIRDVKKHSE